MHFTSFWLRCNLSSFEETGESRIVTFWVGWSIDGVHSLDGLCSKTIGTVACTLRSLALMGRDETFFAFAGTTVMEEASQAPRPGSEALRAALRREDEIF